jgi:gluconate 5-dehydrogenase
MSNLFSLSDKVVVISGGTGYLGSSMVKSLLDFNAKVVSINNSKLFGEEFKNNQNLHQMILDLKSKEKIEIGIKEIIKKFGRIDVLINNAYYGAGKELLSLSESDWIEGIDGTINQVFRISKPTLKHMIDQGGGKIINIASMYGMIAPDVRIYDNNSYYNPANYGSGKAAIIHFTKYIAAVYGRFGVTSNCISPGPFPNLEVQKNKDFIKDIVNRVPLNRYGEPNDLVGLIILLSSNASNFFNGSNIVVDGGWTIW